MRSLLLTTSLLLTVALVTTLAAHTGNPPPGNDPERLAGGINVEAHGPFELDLGWPYRSFELEVPSFDTQNGNRKLVGVVISVTSTGGAGFYGRAGTDVVAGRYTGERWLDLVIQGSSTEGPGDAIATFAGDCIGIAPALADGEEWGDWPGTELDERVEYRLPGNQYWITSDFDIWLDDDGTTELPITGALASTMTFYAGGTIGVRETHGFANLSVYYRWIHATSATAPINRPSRPIEPDHELAVWLTRSREESVGPSGAIVGGNALVVKHPDERPIVILDP